MAPSDNKNTFNKFKNTFLTALVSGIGTLILFAGSGLIQFGGAQAQFENMKKDVEMHATAIQLLDEKDHTHDLAIDELKKIAASQLAINAELKQHNDELSKSLHDMREDFNRFVGAQYGYGSKK
jgi:flagellar biosynthesis component FlhA